MGIITALEGTEERKSYYLTIIDVDDFKTINDTYGHMFGDEVLSRVSEIIRSDLNARGVAGRFGGDEFMILFENVKSEQELRLILKTITKNIQWAFADKALYIAKAKGKNRYIIYDGRKHGKHHEPSERFL